MGNDFYGTPAYWEVSRMLAAIAGERGEPINYGPVFEALGVKGGNYGASQAAGLLGAISTRMHEKGKPLITALVVSKSTSRPGQGFFELAKNLGRLRSDATEADQEAFWVREIEQIYDADWSEAIPGA